MNKPRYINWLIKEEEVTFEDETPLHCYKLDCALDDDVFDEWALHIRRHYVSDEDLEESVSLLSMTPAEYLYKYVIPQKEDGFGCTSRSNDITEILISDLFEFVLSYTVPRCKHDNRSGKTQSEHGTDIIGYKFKNSNKTPSEADRLLAIEVKAGLSSDDYTPIADAINDSHKYDEFRHALTLDFYRKRLKRMNNLEQSKDVSRFQQKPDYPYETFYIGAGVISRDRIENKIIMGLTADSLQLRSDNEVFLVYGRTLMEITHDIYRRCTR